MAQRRTAEELPKLWPQSILFEEPDRSDNEKYKDPFKVAHESIEWILKNHRPEPLPARMRQELKKIVAVADQDEELKREVKGGR